MNVYLISVNINFLISLCPVFYVYIIFVAVFNTGKHVITSHPNGCSNIIVPYRHTGNPTWYWTAEQLMFCYFQNTPHATRIFYWLYFDVYTMGVRLSLGYRRQIFLNRLENTLCYVNYISITTGILCLVTIICYYYIIFIQATCTFLVLCVWMRAIH